MKRSDGAIFLVLAAISFSLVLVDAYIPLQDLRRGVSSITYPTRKLSEFFSQLVVTNRRAAELSQVVMRLALENARLREYRWENERLREIMEFEKEGYYDLVIAEIVGRHTLPPVTHFTVNKGRAEGIKTGMPVCTRDGLVGKIAGVYTHTSLIHTLYDRNCLVSCIVNPSREVGILKSVGGGALCLTGIPLDTHIGKDCEVLSSGLGGVFPEGFRVGKVESVSPDHLGLFSMVKVSPYVDFSKISEVFIITQKKEVRLLPAPQEKRVREIIPTLPPEPIPEFIDEINLLEGQ